MDEKIQEIISKNAYMQRMIKRIPEEMVSYYLEKIKDNIVELPGGIIHSKIGQNGEYMNFALPMEGIELLEYYIGCSNSIPGQDKTHTVANLAIIHYCTKGRAEIIVGSGRYAYMQPGIMCIEWKQEGRKDFNFYDKVYGGMEMIISLDYISREDGDMLKRLGIDMEDFREAYDKDNEYCIGTCSEKLRYAFEDLAEMLREGTVRKENYLVSTINLLNKIQTEEIKVSDRQYYLTKGQRKIVRKIHDMCEEHIGEDITMAELEKKYGISGVSLNKYFEIAYGSTIKRYMQEARMQEAARLLAETNRSVADIALSVGYESQSKFGNVFKRKYGHTPLEYRRLKLSKTEE